KGGGLGVVIALGAVDLAVPRDGKGASSRRSCARARALAAPVNRYLISRPATRSHPRCLLAGTARAPCTDRPEVLVKTPRSRQRALPAGTANRTDGVKTSHPASRKAAHRPDGY